MAKNGKTGKNRIIKRTKSYIHFALDGEKSKVTLKQADFAERYIETLNGTHAALHAYKVANKELTDVPWRQLSEEDKKKRAAAEQTAAQIATENLRKPQIKSYINYLLEESGFTDETIRREHYKLIKQDGDLTNKKGGIDMYYKIRGSYAPEKHEHAMEEETRKAIEKIGKVLP